MLEYSNVIQIDIGRNRRCSLPRVDKFYLQKKIIKIHSKPTWLIDISPFSMRWVFSEMRLVFSDAVGKRQNAYLHYIVNS